MLRICPAPVCMYTDRISAPPGRMSLWYNASTRTLHSSMPLSPAPPCGVARPCRSAAATMTLALPLLRAVCLVETHSPCSGDRKSAGKMHVRQPAHQGRLWASAFPEPRENLRCTLLGAISCVFLMDEERSGLGPSCDPPLGRQLQKPLHSSLDAFQPVAVLCLTNGLEDSLQLLTVEGAVHVGVFSSAIRCATRFCNSPKLVGHGNGDVDSGWVGVRI